MEPSIASFRERPDLAEALDTSGSWPEFLNHGDVTNRYWDGLEREFPDFQLVLFDAETETVLGKGQTVPVAWDATVEGLPGGVDDALEQAFERRPHASALCALVAVVVRAYQGRGLSRVVIEGMRAAAAANGLYDLVAPVRPTLKERYPLTPFERYVRWTRPDGLPFDPWIRLHHRLGAEVLAVAPRSLVVTGTLAEWEEWTGIAFPESGEYVVPGALVPVVVDRERDQGRYEEPNLWMRHRVRQR